MAEFVIEQGKYGKRLVLESREWSKDLTQCCLENDIKELYLNISFGWAGGDLSFLKDLKGLWALDILTDYVEDPSPIHHLTKLRILSVGEILKGQIDFSKFPHLEVVSVNWSPKVKSIFDCKSLKKVLLCKYKSKDGDLSLFNNLPNLESLCFKICNINRIGGISNLRNLKELEIHWASKLDSLQGLESLTTLKKLAIETCRSLRRIDEISALTNLEWLDLSNNGRIETIKPLARLKKLKKLLLIESTNIVDGDLSVLLTLPNLRDVSFGERRHYNLKNKDMPGYEPPDLDAMRKTLTKKGFSPDEVDEILSAFK
jgi:Leucine-rich repeat (LRR) protein